MLLNRDMRMLNRIRARRAEMAAWYPNAINVRTGMTAAEEHHKELDPTPSPSHSGGFDPVKFGDATGALIRESVEPLEKRLAALERGGTQKTAGRAGLSFKGEFQRALGYSEGDVVNRNDRLYVAVKDIPAGDNLREGMEGWVLMIKGVQP